MAVCILNKDFYIRPVLSIARDLLGKYLVIQAGRTLDAYAITDVEAYDGFKDKASHAARGKTGRNAPMFEEGGIWYVYLIYGMYDMLNVVAGPKDYPAAILIRGIEGLNGPGKLTKNLGITRAFNMLSITHNTGLWIEDRGVRISKMRINKSPRVGVDYAGSVWSQKKYRFFL